MQRIEFVATELGGEEVDGVLSVGAAEPSGRYVLFSRNTQDPAEPVYFEFDDQRNGGYAGVAACLLSRTTLTVELEEGAAWLANVIAIEVCLEADLSRWQDFGEKLSRVFAGYQHLLQIIER